MTTDVTRPLRPQGPSTLVAGRRVAGDGTRTGVARAFAPVSCLVFASMDFFASIALVPRKSVVPSSRMVPDSLQLDRGPDRLRVEIAVDPPGMVTVLVDPVEPTRTPSTRRAATSKGEAKEHVIEITSLDPRLDLDVQVGLPIIAGGADIELAGPAWATTTVTTCPSALAPIF